MNILINSFVTIIFAIVILAKQTFFIVNEEKQALVFQFGRIIKDPITDAGLYFKIPFIQKVQYLEKRVLNWDGKPEIFPTKEKKNIIVDTTARWKISDALKFRNSLQDLNNAVVKIENIIDKATKDIISGNNLVETVRNTNSILDKIKTQKKLKADNKLLAIEDLDEIEEEVTGDIPVVKKGREKLSQEIYSSAAERLKRFGIELIDIQIRRIAYTESVEKKVYERMISERNRIAQKIKSIGKGEQAKIEGKIEQELKEISSTAYKQIQEIKGTAEAEATKIYADTMSKDIEFYKFKRTLEMYKDGLKPESKIILSADSEFMKLLKNGIK